MATLTACLLGFGRLASDNEITAIRASGISIFRIATPVIIMSIIISLFLIPLNDQLIPKARFISRSILKEIGMKRPTAFLEAGTFIKDFENYIIFIYAIEGNKLRNIRIYQPQEGKQTRTVVAEEGEIIPIPEKNIIKFIFAI